MHRRIVEKIKDMREKKGFTTADMAEKLNIDHSAYTRLESTKTLTWAKYLEDILAICEVSQEVFFSDLGAGTHVVNEKDSILGNNNGTVENLYADNKEMRDKIDKLHESRISDKENVIRDKDQLITELRLQIELLKNKN